MKTEARPATILRPAGPADAQAIARLHTAVWRDTYRDLAPPAAYQALDERRRHASWLGILGGDSPASTTVVADVDGSIAGFGLCGAPGDPAFGGRGEVKYLYVDRLMARRGLGRRLLLAMAGRLHDQRYPGLALGVVAGNDPAIAFYRAMGGTMIGRYRDPGPLWRSENLVFAWDDLARLATRDG